MQVNLPVSDFTPYKTCTTSGGRTVLRGRLKCVNNISLECLCIDCVNQVKKLAWSGQEVLSPRKVSGARCPAYGGNELYSNASYVLLFKRNDIISRFFLCSAPSFHSVSSNSLVELPVTC